MGSKKWIKAVFGLQKTNKLQPSEEDGNSSGSTGEIWHQREQHSVDHAGSIAEKELNTNVVVDTPDAKDEKFQSVNHFYGIDNGIHEDGSEPSAITEVEDAENTSSLSMKQSDDIDHGIYNNESHPNAIEDVEDEKGAESISSPASSLSTTLVTVVQDANDASLQFVLSSASSPSTLLLEKNASQVQQKEREEWAAIHIQAAFRRFQARRSARELRGLVRLKALATSRAVRKQATITFHSMQNLVRVQARIRARRVRMGLENQIAQEKLQQQLEQEAPIKETTKETVKETDGSGWCGSAGSAQEIKAKLDKRKEAAAKREKAKAYALARQWQASPKQRAKPVSPVQASTVQASTVQAGAVQDKIYWSWNWSDSWMVSSQWESRAVEVNVEDGNEPADPRNKSIARSTSMVRKVVRCPGIKSGITSEASHCSSPVKSPHLKQASHCSSPVKSPHLKQVLSPRTPTRSPRTIVRDSGEEFSPRFYSSLRSRSTPKERSPLGDNQGKKRLSLPDSGQQYVVQPTRQPSQPVIKRTVSAPRPSP